MNKKRLKPKTFAEVLTAGDKELLSDSLGLDDYHINDKNIVMWFAASTKDRVELAIFAKHPDFEVRENVAMNQNKSEETRKILLSDYDAAVRHFAAMSDDELKRFKEENKILEGDLGYSTSPKSSLSAEWHMQTPAHAHGKAKYLLRDTRKQM